MPLPPRSNSLSPTVEGREEAHCSLLCSSNLSLTPGSLSEFAAAVMGSGHRLEEDSFVWLIPYPIEILCTDRIIMDDDDGLSGVPGGDVSQDGTRRSREILSLSLWR